MMKQHLLHWQILENLFGGVLSFAVYVKVNI